MTSGYEQEWGFFLFFFCIDYFCDLQANDAEKLLLMGDEWRGQLCLECCLHVPHYRPQEVYNLTLQQRFT